MFIRDEIKAIMERDPAARSVFEALLYPSLHALLFHRIAHRLYLMKIPFFPRMLNQLARFFTGIDIHPGAKIGQGLFIDHGMGVVIGETAEIGNNVTLYQGVTLGGTGKQRGKRHPTVEDDAYIGVSALVLGAITIGKGARIGGGSVVLKDVPPYTTAVGVPAKVVAVRGNLYDENQPIVNLPDPQGDMLDALQSKSDELEGRLRKLLDEHLDQIHEVQHEHEAINNLDVRLASLEEKLERIEKGLGELLIGRISKNGVK
jgi:serine O-acetyltransferase